MKLYFSVWGYCDPSRVGYDTVGVTYHREKPSVYAGIGSAAVYSTEIPDTYTQEEADEIGEKAAEIMEDRRDVDPARIVREVIAARN